MLWARDTVVDVVAAHFDDPVAGGPRGGREAHVELNLLALLSVAHPERELVATAGAVDDPYPSVLLVQLRRPEAHVGKLSLGQTDRGQMRFGHEAPIDQQLLAVQLEGGVLCLYVENDSGRGEEGVKRLVAAAKVGAAAKGEVEMGVLGRTGGARGARVLASQHAQHGRERRGGFSSINFTDQFWQPNPAAAAGPPMVQVLGGQFRGLENTTPSPFSTSPPNLRFSSVCSSYEHTYPRVNC